MLHKANAHRYPLLPSHILTILPPAYLREVQEAHEGLHVGQLHSLRECCGVQALGVAALIVQEALPQLHLLQLVVPTFAWRVRRQAGRQAGR
jgi:hypothetical protein